jgi:hypothetical protein
VKRGEEWTPEMVPEFGMATLSQDLVYRPIGSSDATTFLLKTMNLPIFSLTLCLINLFSQRFFSSNHFPHLFSNKIFRPAHCLVWFCLHS